jgi:phospholipase C
MTSATYAVKAGDTLTKRISLSLFAESGYFIEVLGPNGFYRSFIGGPGTGGLDCGRLASFPVEVRASYERQGVELTGNVQVELHNKSTEPVSISIEDNSYQTEAVSRKIMPGQEISVVLPLKQSHSWYDFTVRVDGSNAEARYTGRVETGTSGFSDPLMGGVVQTT